MPSEKLEFTKQEPAFLRKLREQHGGPRNNVQTARPKKDRLRTDNVDDDPVIVDESGENVGKEEWEGMLKREKEGGVEAEKPQEGDGADKVSLAEKERALRDGQKVADIGVTKKRKAVKVIGEDDVDKDADSKVAIESKDTTADEIMASKTKDAATHGKTKKKAKKIKLSFDDPD